MQPLALKKDGRDLSCRRSRPSGFGELFVPFHDPHPDFDPLEIVTCGTSGQWTR